MDERLLEQWGSLVASEVLRNLPLSDFSDLTDRQAGLLADAIIGAIVRTGVFNSGGDLLRRAVHQRRR